MAEPRDRTSELPPYTPPTSQQAPVKDPDPPPDIGGGGSNNPPTNLGTLNVPENILIIAQKAAAQYQVPLDLLLAVMYQESKYDSNARNAKNPGGGIDRGIAQINSKYHPEVTDAQAYDPSFAINMLAQSTAATYHDMVAHGQAPTKDTWWDAAANWHQAVHDNEWTTYRTTIKNWADNGFAAGPDSNLSTRGGSSPHTDPIGNLSDTDSFALHQVADSLYVQLLGRMPTDAEYLDIFNNHWNSAQLEDFLRSQKYGNSPVTIGTAGDLRDTAHQQAKAILGRDATEGEINWLIQNNIPTTNVSAYYEQIRDHAVWATDPVTYRDTRSRIAALLSKDFGVSVPVEKVDAAMVNQAATGKMDDSTIELMLAGTQAPGQPAGVTLGEVKRVNELAGKIWDEYFPGLLLPTAERNAMIGMNPDDIMKHIRSLPSEENPAIQAGVYHDTKLAVQDVYNQMGIVGRMPSVADVTMAAGQNNDKEAIWQSLAKQPDLLAVNPGLPFHMSRQGYYQERSTIEGSYYDIFGKGGDNVKLLQAKVDNPEPGAAPAEPDYLKSIFAQGIGETEARSNFADYFKRLGRPPTIDEVNQFKTKVTQQYSSTSAEPQTQATDIGPTAPLLGGPKRNNAFGTAV